MSPSEESERATRLLVAYWQANPLAGDTAEGIHQWWIGRTAVTRQALDEALQQLVRQGRVTVAQAADGRIRYRWVA